MTQSILDALWPIAKLEGFRNRDDLDRLDLSKIVIDQYGKLIVPPQFFDIARFQSPSLFKRASEMTAAERADFVKNASGKQRAKIALSDFERATKHLPPPRPDLPRAKPAGQA